MFINPRWYRVNAMSATEEKRTRGPAELADEDAKEIYNVVKSLRSDARDEIKRALGRIWPLSYSCPCGARVHHLSEFLGTSIKIEGFEEFWNYLYGVKIKLQWLDGEQHEAYIWTKAILPKLKRLLRNKQSVWAKPRLKFDLEAE